ncbi:MAG TPA: YceI family protein [Acidobacteriaceae bacterium]
MKLARFVPAGIAAATMILLAPSMRSQTTWKSDPAHSEVDFSILHMGIANVHGRFGPVECTVVSNDQDATKSTVQCTIHVDGVDTGVAPRDNDLKSANYFDVAQFPTATFASTSVTKGGSGMTIQGNLTLKGATRPVTLDVSGPTGPIEGMGHKTHEGFEATTTLRRTDFGIGAKVPTAMLGDEVKLTIELDLAKQ